MLTSHERQSDIAMIATKVGHVSVAGLATQFDVTPETIRRDLKALEARGTVSRVHGGAVAIATLAKEPGFSEKPWGENSVSHVREKAEIAQLAVESLPAGHVSMFVDAGSSSAAFLKHLARMEPAVSRFTIVTASVSLAALCSDLGLPDVHLIGGRIRPHSTVSVGESTVEQISRLRADCAILSTNGFSFERGFSTPDPAEAAVKQAMVHGARSVLMLADSSKFERDFLVTFAEASDINVLFTDKRVSDHTLSLFAEQHVQVVCTS